MSLSFYSDRDNRATKAGNPKTGRGGAHTIQFSLKKYPKPTKVADPQESGRASLNL